MRVKTRFKGFDGVLRGKTHSGRFTGIWLDNCVARCDVTEGWQEDGLQRPKEVCDAKAEMRDKTRFRGF